MENKDIKNTGQQFQVIQMGAELRVPNYSEKWDKRDSCIFWGDNNLYPDYLISLMNKSGKHNSIIKTKASIVGGNGFTRSGLSESALEFLDNIYDEDTLDDILAKISYDVEISGAFALSIVWSKKKDKIAQISYINFSTVRIGKNDAGDDFYQICDDWSNTRKNPITAFPKFNPAEPGGQQIFFYQEYRPGNFWYPQPEYISAANWIELEYEISNFHLRSVQNGFAPSMLMNLNQGVPSEEEMKSTERRLKAIYEGTNNAGKLMLTFNESRETAPEIHPIELNSSDERFIQLDKTVEAGIFQGHRVTNPALFGVKTPGELGGTNDQPQSLSVFDTMYASPKQRSYERIFNLFMDINGIADELRIKKYVLKIETQLPVSDLITILTSPISPEQKSVLLQNFGWTKDDADRLVKGNITQPTI